MSIVQAIALTRVTMPELSIHEVMSAYRNLQDGKPVTGPINFLEDGYTIRKELIKVSSFPFLHEDWINPLKEYLKCKRTMEIMAGSGALGRMLGINLLTDNNSWAPQSGWNTWNIVPMDCRDAVRRYAEHMDVVLCSWPYMDDLAVECLRIMRVVNPNCRLLYLGESMYGCTANEAFFDEAIAVNDPAIDAINEIYRKYQWGGIHDEFQLYK